MSIFAAMNKAAKDARERDIRAGKAAPEEPEGQHPLVRFYEESLSEIPSGGSINPPPIRPIKDRQPEKRARRSTRKAGKSVEADSVDSEIRRTSSPSPSDGTLYRRFVINS